MIRVIFLTCVGVCVGQLPPHSYYLSLAGSSLLSNDFRHQRAQFAGSQQNQQPNILSHNQNVNQSIQNVNQAGGSGQFEEQQQQQQQVADVQLRHLDSSRIASGYQVPLESSPYTNLRSLQAASSQTQPGSLPVSNSRSGLDSQYSGPSLFTQSEPDSSHSLASYPTNNLPIPTYNSRYEGHREANYGTFPEPVNQNGYIQQTTRGGSDSSNYQFSYDVDASEGGRSVQFAHEERRRGDEAAGSYSVLLPDGQIQVVEYTADQDGYRPSVRYDGAAPSVVGNDNPSMVDAQSTSIESRHLPLGSRPRSYYSIRS